MMLLALTCERVRAQDEHVAQLLLSGELSSALRIGFERLERSAAPRDPHRTAAVGQMLARALLDAGRAQDAEDVFQQLTRTYEDISRASVRWLSSLDQAAMSLHLGRWGRAAEAWNSVAEDDAAPPLVRVEAMCGMACALRRMGEHKRAMSTLREAARMAEAAQHDGMCAIVTLLQLELAVRAWLETRDGLSDYALAIAERSLNLEPREALAEKLRALATGFAEHPLVEHGLNALHLVLCGEASGSAGRAKLNGEMKWLRDRGFVALEEDLRLDAALGRLASDDAQGALDALGILARSEDAAQRHRLAIDLKYCWSRLDGASGRQADALRRYKEYAREALYRIARERSHVPHSRFLERQHLAEEGDAAMFRLPLRYRRAYRYILERLDDSTLSIKQVAAHIGVTERALQMAFRKHLGMTPAEMIRHQRMQGIRNDLRDSSGQQSVLKTAARWGLTNRSTLAHAYRQMFAETPTATLRGGA